MQQNPHSDIKDIRKFVLDWNSAYPIDRWWRNEYKIPFGSEAHTNQSLIDMRIAFEENHMYDQLKLDAVTQEREKKITYFPGRGNWLKKQKAFEVMTEQEEVDLFDSIDVAHLQEEVGEDGKIQIRI